MKKIITFSVILFCVLKVSSQQQTKGLPNSKPKKIRCYTDEAIKAARLSNPNIETEAQFETWLAKKNLERKANQVNGTLGTITNYYLPIVFHIIHSGEAVGSGTNISQALINAQVTQLNKDFGNLSGSTYSVASTTGIKFGLATTSPTGATLSEPGIDRISYSSKGWTAPPYDGSSTYFDGTIKPASIWDPSRYVNVWICDQSTSGLLGIATFPASSTLSGLDNLETNQTAGVVIEVTSVGSKTTSSDCGVSNQYDMGRTVTHELGHFFGLRHIWGDASSCASATDYCNDTPKSLVENYGKPVHPKPNSCGTVDEMFENFMDYTDDQILNTFTANQADRIQTVMLNSPRRVSLATSTVGKTLPSNNSIGFDNCLGTTIVSEKGTTGTTNRYTDINIPLAAESAASGNATLTFTTAAISGTSAPALAVAGVDYQILTPTVSFTNGDITKNVVVRIIDNAKVDGRRGFALTYNISGAGVVAGSLPQTMNIIINDDDNIIIGQNTINLLNESFNDGNMPSGWSTFKSASYNSQWVIGSNGTAGGTAPNAYISSSTTTKPNTYTTTTSSAGAVLETPLIEGYRVASLGNLSFKFKVKGRTYSTTNGTGHYGQLFFTSADDLNNNYNDYGTVTGNTGNGPWGNTSTLQTGTPSIASSFLNNSRFYVDFYWAVTSTSAASNPGLNIDDVVLSATPWNVETTISNSYTFNTQSGSSNIFRNAVNNKAIASITAQSVNVDNVVASITESGTDRPTFNSGATTYYRSRKTFKIIPGNASNATNTITLYFTQAEIAAWSTSFTNAKIMKIDEGVDLGLQIISTSNAIIANTSVTDKLTTDGYVAFTATFNGYGQYVIVEQAAVLPLQWGLFTGHLDGSKVALKWNTFNESNNNGFEVERATNTSDFIKIGFVNAQNNKTNNYNFIDNNINLGNRYNYRLKQIDNYGKFSYSSVISILYSGKDKYINVYPNPISSKLFIQIGNAIAGKSEVVITDILGKIVFSNKNVQNNSIEIATSNWSKGTYFATIKTIEGEQTFKVIKE